MATEKTAAKPAKKPSAKTAKPVVLITDSSVLGALIKSIAGRSKALDADLHKAALACVHFAFENNAASAEQLLAALGKSTRKNALKLWLFEHAPLMVKDNGAFGIDQDKRKDGWTTQAEAIARPFWLANVAEGGGAPDPVDAMIMVREFLAKLRRMDKAGKFTKESASVIGKIEKVAPAISV